MIRRLAARLLPHVRQLGGGRLEDRILFLHIPKCGGTSIADAIGAAYGWAGARRTSHLDAAASWRGSRLSGMALFEYRERLLLYEMGRPHLRYITGHYPLSETALREFGDDWSVVTVIRDPVDRWFSHYFYNRYKQGDYFATDQSLEEYLDSHTGIGQARTYVRWFSGELSDDWSGASVDRAIENLDRIAVLGVLERLDRFRQEFDDRFGVRLRIPRLNTSPRPAGQRDGEISDSIRRQVEELCRDDLRIYRHALERAGG